MEFTFMDDMLLGDARGILQKLIVDGHECPCCNQLAKEYRRRVHSSMARLLIRVWKAAGEDWAYLPDIYQKARDGAALAYWGLIEAEKAVREDGGRTGWWRVTAKGKAFVLAQITVPKYAMVYNKCCFDLRGPPVTIHTALGTKFDYNELMNA